MRRRFMAALMALALVGMHGASTPASGQMMSWSDIGLSQKVLPGVVNITVEKIVHDGTNEGQGRREMFYGSGFIIDPAGTVVTNRHVIEGAVWITVSFADRSEARGFLVAACGLMDLAVLKVDAGRPLPFLKFGDSDRLHIGDPVLAIGNPLGLGVSVSGGIVSALNRNIMETPFDDDIQTDAAINHGNSGGPLINREGEVIGVNTALTSIGDNGGSIGIGYAIPSDEANFVVHQLLNPNLRPPGWIGIHLQDVSPDLARAFGLSWPHGFIVTGVEPGGPAAAVLQTGDIILRFGELEPPDTRALLRDILVMPTDQFVPVIIWRNGQQQEVAVKVMPWPNLKIERGNMLASVASAQQSRPPSLGLGLAPVTDAVRKQFSLAGSEGVLVTNVDPDAQVYDRGVAPGDVILKVQDTAVNSADQVQHLVDQARDRQQVVALLVLEKGAPRWITVYLGTGGPPPAAKPSTPESIPQVAASPAKR
ncbi:MAG TPA: trypsin-like peptidase domain-containing protein [Acetobacteraceae bacterium]|nr:trypsin-like peptidase domain-containing protein [Acetobacteraceae bacterium]